MEVDAKPEVAPVEEKASEVVEEVKEVPEVAETVEPAQAETPAEAPPVTNGATTRQRSGKVTPARP